LSTTPSITQFTFNEFTPTVTISQTAIQGDASDWVTQLTGLVQTTSKYL
jgi:hypothetical protein